MFGIDANLNAGTAVLLIIISLIFVWGAMYAASVGVLAIWGITLLVAFVSLYVAYQRAFTRLKYGKSRVRK